MTAQQLELRRHIMLARALLRACFSLLHHLEGSQACSTHEAGRRPSPAHTSRTWPAPPQPCRWARCGVRGREGGPERAAGQGNSTPALSGAFARHRRPHPSTSVQHSRRAHAQAGLPRVERQVADQHADALRVVPSVPPRHCACCLARPVSSSRPAISPAAPSVSFWKEQQKSAS